MNVHHGGNKITISAGKRVFEGFWKEQFLPESFKNAFSCGNSNLVAAVKHVHFFAQKWKQLKVIFFLMLLGEIMCVLHVVKVLFESAGFDSTILLKVER